MILQDLYQVTKGLFMVCKTQGRRAMPRAVKFVLFCLGTYSPVTKFIVKIIATRINASRVKEF